MFRDAEVNGHARRIIGCAVIFAFAAVLMQCAHGQPGTAEQPPLLPQPLGAETRVFRDCPGCPEMVEIPGGTFRMGTNGWRDDTRPAHTVTVNPFSMGLREVTRDEYAAFAAATGLTPRSCPVPPVRQGRCPVPDLARRQGLRRVAQPPYGSALSSPERLGMGVRGSPAGPRGPAGDDGDRRSHRPTGALQAIAWWRRGMRRNRNSRPGSMKPGKPAFACVRSEHPSSWNGMRRLSPSRQNSGSSPPPVLARSKRRLPRPVVTATVRSASLPRPR